MFFRFVFALLLVVAVSLLGVALEKRILALKRATALQQYRAEQLDEQGIRLRLRTQQLGAPARLIEDIDTGRIDLQPTLTSEF